MHLLHAQAHEVKRRNSIGIWKDLSSAIKRRHRRIKFQSIQETPSSITDDERANLATQLHHLRDSIMLKSEFKQCSLRYQHWHPSKPTVQHTTSHTNHLLRQLYPDADAYRVDLERDVEGVFQLDSRTKDG
jgi:hypothetical protein